MSLFGVKWQPFKNPTKVTFDPKSLGFNDLLTGASLLSLGGAGSLANIGKWSLGTAAKGLGANTSTAGLLGGFMSPTGNPSANAQPGQQTGLGLDGISSMLGPIAMQELSNVRGNMESRQNAINAAANALNPSAQAASVARMRAEGMSQGVDQARKIASLFGAPVGAGYAIDAANQANTQANRAYLYYNSPDAIIQRNAMIADLYRPDYSATTAYTGLLDSIMENNRAGQQLRQNRPPSTLETLVGSVLPIATQINWGKVFSKPSAK